MGGKESSLQKEIFEEALKSADYVLLVEEAVSLMPQTNNQIYYADASWADFPLSKLPSEIKKLNPRQVIVSSDHLMMEYHGGMIHFGFTVSKNKDTWVLESYTDENSETLHIKQLKAEQVATGQRR
jgi:hypothetical protein